MNFFNWIKWIFSKQVSINIDSLAFDHVTKQSYYQKNGIFYDNNVRHKLTNCTFKAYREPDPLNVNVEVEMNIANGDVYAHYFNDNTAEPIVIIPSDEPVPFEIVYSKEPQLTKQEKADQRLERFVDAMVNWNDRGKV